MSTKGKKILALLFLIAMLLLYARPNAAAMGSLTGVVIMLTLFWRFISLLKKKAK